MKGRGVVVSLNGDRADVQVTTASECMGCASKAHCGFGAQDKRKIVVINDHGARISDHVVFEAESGKVILSAVLIWIVPLLAMMVGYFAANMFSSGFIPIGVSIFFLVTAFGFLKFIDTKISGGRSFYPRITHILEPSMSDSESCPGHECD